jgi:hypothetical protein
MNIIDLLIGLTLMNAMPHFILGVWKGRMLSAFGFGDYKNMPYGVLNFALSLGLFVSRYGTEQLFKKWHVCWGVGITPHLFPHSTIVVLHLSSKAF